MAKLKFYYGVMGAGKTTELIKTYDIYKRKGLNPVVIKPKIDDREGKQSGWGTTSSRLIKDPIPAYYFENIKDEIWKLDYGIILVDEAQFISRDDALFLTDIVEKQKIDIIAYGLKTDVNGNLFKGAADLLVLADETKELETICETPNCQNKASMHLRYINGQLDNSGEAVAIEKGDVTYKSVCRSCWNNARKGR